MLKGTLQRLVQMVRRYSDKDLIWSRVSQPADFQVLSTCKQACGEGLTAFYSCNVFYLLLGDFMKADHALSQSESHKPDARGL